MSAAVEPKKLTQQDLFRQYLEDENLFIDTLDWTPENWRESESKLSQRIEAMEKIQFEAKTRATALYKKIREQKSKHGVGIWDKTPLNPDNLINSSKDAWEEKKKRHQKTLNKVETAVKNFITLGYTDDEIMEALPDGPKFKGVEVREAIEKMRGK